MAHNLYLGMYTFSIKKRRGNDDEVIGVDDFLEQAYYEIKENRFEKGFVPDLVKILDTTAYKNAKKTHGALIDKSKFNRSKRTLDILIDGGITGISQFLIKEDGKKEALSSKAIVGPKFFARFWLPSGSDIGYIFIQRYGSISIKTLYDSLLKDYLKSYNCSLVSKRVRATTTKKRLQKFLKHSELKEISVVSRESISSSEIKAQTAEVKLKRLNFKQGFSHGLSKELIEESLAGHGFSLGERKYEVKGVYEYNNQGHKEERTVNLDSSEETFNVVPNIIIPDNCIDINNYPDFSEMRSFVDEEIDQVIKESRL